MAYLNVYIYTILFLISLRVNLLMDELVFDVNIYLSQPVADVALRLILITDILSILLYLMFYYPNYRMT
jgi:hypothetical protein